MEAEAYKSFQVSDFAIFQQSLTDMSKAYKSKWLTKFGSSSLFYIGHLVS
jgi:hypothetical protein